MGPRGNGTALEDGSAGAPHPWPRQRALVVFEHRSDLWSLRLLRPGFRHCFCAVGSAFTWTICDPLKTRLEIRTVSGLTERELARHFHEQGRLVLLGDVCADLPRRPHRLRVLTCVEVVKRILNVDLPGALTPFRLYHALLGLRTPLVPFAPHGFGDAAPETD